MQKFRLYAVLSLGALSCLSASFGQQPATPSTKAAPSTNATTPTATVPEGQQPSRDDVVKMMDAMRVHAQLEAMTKAMNAQMKQQIHQTLQSQPNMTPEQVGKFEEGYDKGASLYPVSEMMDDMIPIYQRHVSKSDIDAIIAFYASPAGQHLLTQGPAMMKDSMSVVMPKVQARMQAYMEKVKKDSGSAAPATGVTPVAPSTSKPATAPSTRP